MTDFQKHYALWDEFMSVWPLERLKNMTLGEYTQAGAKDTFTYWIESKLEELGSIWGGSAFKFGVFSRKATDEKKSDATRSYSDIHGWYSSLGLTAEEAFKKVRNFIVEIATSSAKGDFNQIERLDDLGQTTKWKIAFLYQDRNSSQIVNIYTRAPLAAYVGSTVREHMVDLQKAVVLKRPDNMGILEFGYHVWDAWSRRNLTIWKLSHGAGEFTQQEVDQYLDEELGVMHGGTLKGQGDNFSGVGIGTLFYLCNGNRNLLLIGQFISDAAPWERGRAGCNAATGS